jgi:hypothetical protein
MIQKRNGRQEILDITKIQKHTISATRDLEDLRESNSDMSLEEIKEQKRQIHLKITKYITQIKLIQSILINSTIKLIYSNANAINLLFLINIFGNNSSEKPHTY